MKKQFFTLVMMLAIVVLAGTSAMAQNNAATNASNGRYIMITGSSHTFSVARGESGSTIAWTLVREAGQTVDGAQTAADNQFTVTWDQNASGNYYVQAIETRNGIACANTTRRFYVNVLDFDVWVYVSDASGNRISGASLASCGDGTTANYGNELIGGTTGLAFSNAHTNTNGTLDALTGTAALDLNNVELTDGFTRRYITMGVVWNNSVNAADAAAMTTAIDSLRFDYSAAVSEGLINVNGTAAATASGVYASTKVTPGDLTALGANSFGFTIPMDFNDLWEGVAHSNITFNLTATNVSLMDGTSVLGIEPDAREGGVANVPPTTPYANTSETGTIQLAPATSVISVSQN